MVPEINEIQERAYSNGMSFLLAAQTLMVPKPLTETTYQQPMGPAIVCYAFSIELFLKSIHLREGTSHRGHNLRDLFDALPPSTKSLISTQFYNRFGMNEFNYRIKISEVKNLFNDFRYIQGGLKFEAQHSPSEFRYRTLPLAF